MPAFALLELEPDGKVDGCGTDPMSSPEPAASCGSETVGVEGVAAVCDTSCDGGEGDHITAGYSKYLG
jgi:hypothetical protein